MGTELLSLNADLVYLTPSNTCFEITKNGFATAKIGDDEKFDRVHLSRVFPHDLTEEFISVTDKDGNERGIIKALCDFDEDTAEKLRKELERKYFSAEILKIVSVEEKFGNSVWTVETANGMRIMTLKDTFKSIIRIGDDRALIVDEDANRYEIKSLSSLDKNSFRKIELYL